MPTFSLRRWQGRLGLTIGLTLAAGLTLAYLGLLAVGDREQAARVTYAATSVLIRDRILAELSALEADTGRLQVPVPASADLSAIARQWPSTAVAAQPWGGELLLIRQGGGVRTALLSHGWVESRIGASVGTPTFAAAVRDAEQDEFVRGDFKGALGVYRKALGLVTEPAAHAMALSRIGRTLFKLRQFQAGVAAYQEVLAISPKTVTDPNGVPYAAAARSQIVDGFQALGRAEERNRVGIELLTWALDHPWDSRDGYGYYLSLARTAFAPPNSDLDARAAARLDDLEWLEWIDQVARPKLETDQEGSEGTFRRLVLERHGTPVLISARALGSESGQPAMRLGFTVRGDEVVGPLLDHVLAGVELGRDLVISVVDQNGRDLRTSKVSASPLASSDLAPFTGWRVAILDGHGRTLQQLGARERWVYGAFVLGAIGVLVAGLLIAARAWARDVELSRLRADFVSNVSHELKTPLALIRMFGETLESGLVTETARQHEFHGIIRRESERLTHLINNVLDIAKIDAGTKRFVLSPADLRALVVETLDAYAPLLTRLGFAVSADLPEHPAHVDMDRDAIAQVLVNLFQNAIKYSPDTKHVGVALTLGSHEVRLSVTDRGIGIAATEIPRIFETYYRVVTPDTSGSTGSGLGLAIVQHTMIGHRGRVDVSSVPGAGSTFVLVFPRDPGDRNRVVAEAISGGRVRDEVVN